MYKNKYTLTEIHIIIAFFKNFVLYLQTSFTFSRLYWVGIVISMSASHMVGRGFASPPGHTKDHQKNGTNCLPTLHACVRVGVKVQPNFLKGRIVCGTVYGDMHLKDFLGSIATVGYCIPGCPDFYLVLHGLRCQKSTIMD